MDRFTFTSLRSDSYTVQPKNPARPASSCVHTGVFVLIAGAVLAAAVLGIAAFAGAFRSGNASGPPPSSPSSPRFEIQLNPFEEPNGRRLSIEI